jgi:phosphatidylglycerophosphatase A
MFSLKLWVAQGFGVGRIPFGPGTFGSIVGLGWTALLIATGSFWFFLGGTIAGLALSVWLCGEGEKILKQKDPSSVVLDEIAAMPVCFVAWVWGVWHTPHAFPPVEKFFSSWTVVLFVFVFFRFFDIFKPWPVKQSQSLPGGWGVTVDDLLAAVYVNVLLGIAVLVGIK